MSKLLASIKDIKSVDNLNIVVFDFYGTKLKMMSLELSENIKIGSKVLLSTKPTSVALAKNFDGDISFSNQLRAKVIDIDKGELLCCIKLFIANSIFESIITIDSLNKLHLKIDDEVTAFIKASDISIYKVCDD